MLPLVGAEVVLWNTAFRSRTDDNGLYHMADVPPGVYQVAFFHADLAAQGISAPPRIAHVVADSVRIDLASPSLVTIALARCRAEGTISGTGVVVGTVSDAHSGIGLPGVRVSLSWETSDGRSAGSRRMHTDGRGRFRFCKVPAGREVLASATFLNRFARTRQVEVPDGGGVATGLFVEPMSHSVVAGTLTDAATGEAIADAAVRLGGTGLVEITDAAGRFGFMEVVPGDHSLLVKHVAYGRRSDRLEVPTGSKLDLQVHLDLRPIPLPPLLVDVGSASVSERTAGGIRISRDEIESVRHQARDVGDLLRSQQLAGIIVRRRADHSLCVGTAQGQVRMLNNQGCVPMVVFVNGARVGDSDLALRIPPEAVDRITIYKPVEAGSLFGPGSGNGVLMIYTKGN